MRTVFADTFCFIALLDSAEKVHERAKEFLFDKALRIITTEWVLSKCAATFSHPKDRGDFAAVVRALQNDQRVKIIASDSEQFWSGFQLFRARRDKQWSLVDCISFQLMERENITEALTGDHHFEQAGFIALLKGSGS